MSTDTLESQVVQQARAAFREAIEKTLIGYNSPLNKIIEGVIGRNSLALDDLLSEAIAGLIRDAKFRQEMKDAARAKLAKLLIDKMGGEMEKQVNLLKSNPATRARITVAIEEVVASLGGAA